MAGWLGLSGSTDPAADPCDADPRALAEVVFKELGRGLHSSKFPANLKRFLGDTLRVSRFQ